MRRITVIGNLTQDAEVKQVGQKKVINFSVATNEKYKDSSGNMVDKSYYYACAIWRDSNVKIAEYLTRGTKVFIEGTPDVEIYKDKNGEYKSSIKILVGNVELIGGGRKESQTSIEDKTKSNKNDDDDLPF